MPYEWGFTEPSDQVDVERIYCELSGPAILQYVYVGQLRVKAPKVYGRLRDWARVHGVMTAFQWYDDDGKPIQPDAPGA